MTVRKNNPIYEVLETQSTEGIIMNETRLFTHAPSGLYRARFKYTRIEKPMARKTGQIFTRLAVGIEVIDGPIDSIDKYQKGSENIGRVLSIWTQLELNDAKTPMLSPNWWLAPYISAAPGQTLHDKLQNWGEQLKWVAVNSRKKRVSKIIGFSTKDKPAKTDWTWE